MQGAIYWNVYHLRLILTRAKQVQETCHRNVKQVDQQPTLPTYKEMELISLISHFYQYCF